MATKKSYNTPEDDSSRVEEPALAYQTEVELLRQETVDLIMQINDTEVLKDILCELAYHAATSQQGPSPVQFTLEELKEQLTIAQEESRLGLGIDHEEVLKRDPQWWISK